MPLHQRAPKLPLQRPVSPSLYDDILLAQETAEDQRLLARAHERQRAAQQYSCPADNETTPWLKHANWPDRFQDRPLDIITATAQLPSRAPNEDCYLGRWQGEALVSPVSNEAKLRILMQSADQMFARVQATLSGTSYRLRC
jgi:hypothetical protein